MKLKKILEQKRQTEAMYQEAFNSMVKQSEEESHVILNRYFYVKKLRKRDREFNYLPSSGKNN